MEIKRKSYVMKNKELYIDESADEELHDERVYVTELNRVCLPGKQYLLKVRSVEGMGDGIKITFLDGSTKEYDSCVYLGRESAEVGGKYEPCWQQYVLHKVYYEVKKDILSVGTCKRMVRFIGGKKVYADYMISNRYSFNLKTARSYVHAERFATPDSHFENRTAFHQFSFFEVIPVKIPAALLSEIIGVMLDYKEKVLGYRPTVSGNGFSNWVAVLASINECPAYNQVMSLLPTFVNRYYFNKCLKNQSNPIKSFCEMLEVPYNRTTRKLFTKNPLSLFTMSQIMKSGVFNNFDNIVRLVNAFCDSEDSIASAVLHPKNVYVYNGFVSERAWVWNNYYLVKRGPFIKDVVQSKEGLISGVDWVNDSLPLKTGFESVFVSNYAWFVEELFNIYGGSETLVTNALCREGYSVCDCLNMVSDMMGAFKKPEERKYLRRKDCPFGKNMKGFNLWVRRMCISGFDKYHHDLISQDVRWYKYAKKKVSKIRYSAKEFELEENINGYRFVLPRTDRELLDVGRDMRICVGSYGNAAVRKSLDIVVVTNEADEYIVCMELDSSATVAYQVKLYCNTTTNRSTPIGKAIYKWMSGHRISCETYDFNGPKFKRIDADADPFEDVV